MTNYKNKYQYVFSMRLAGHLMTMGYKLLRVNHNLKDDSKDVYVFEYSDEIHEIVENYIKTKEK